MATPVWITTPTRKVYFHVEQHDALTYDADVLVLKYAQELFGVDRAVAKALIPKIPNLTADLPAIGDSRIVDCLGQLGATRVLFIGVPTLRDFRYRELRAFGRATLEVLAKIPV